MSNNIYDATRPNIGSDRTLRAKELVTKIITEQLSIRGYKTDIREEVPAVVDGKKYHADLGVLFRSKTEYDFYHFFIVEIDWIIGHGTARSDRRERLRDEAFLKRFGIETVRIPLQKISGKSALKYQDLFESLIWPVLVDHYIEPISNQKMLLWQELNRAYSIKLKENAYTQCNNCQHKAHLHNLSGCEFQNTNKAKLKCNCTNPFFTSDL